MFETNREFNLNKILDPQLSSLLKQRFEKPLETTSDDVRMLFNRLDGSTFFAALEELNRRGKKSNGGKPLELSLILYADESGASEGAIRTNLLRAKTLMGQKDRFGVASCVIVGNEENKKKIFDLVPGLSGVVDFSAARNE